MTTSNYVLFFKRHLGNAEHGKGEKLVWLFVFTVILVNFCFQVVLVGGLLWENIWTFDVVLKCLSACVWFQNFIWDVLNSRWKEKLGLNICFLFTVSQFLISSCPWTAFLRIRLNLWCSFKVSERLRLISKLHLGHAELEMKGETWSEYLFPFYC